MSTSVSSSEISGDRKLVFSLFSYCILYLVIWKKAVNAGKMVRRASPRPPALRALVTPTPRIFEPRFSRSLPSRPDTHPSRARSPPGSRPCLAFCCVVWVPLLALFISVGSTAGGPPFSPRSYRSLSNSSVVCFRSPSSASRLQFGHVLCFLLCAVCS